MYYPLRQKRYPVKVVQEYRGAALEVTIYHLNITTAHP